MNALCMHKVACDARVNSFGFVDSSVILLIITTTTSYLISRRA